MLQDIDRPVCMESAMPSNETSEVVRRFNKAFLERDPAVLEGLIARDCVMETIQLARDTKVAMPT